MADFFSPIFDFLRIYIIPSGVLATLFTVFLDRYAEIKKRSNEVIAKKESVRDTLLAAITRITAYFDNLRLDAEQSSYFGFKNLNSVRPMIEKVQNIADGDVVVFSEDNELRTEIITVASSLTSVWNDMNGLETYKNNEDAKVVEAYKKYQEEIKMIRSKMSKYDVEVVGNFDPIVSSLKANKNKLKITTTMLVEAKKTYDAVESAVNGSNQWIKEKRVFYSIKILDVQTKLKHLEDLLKK